MGFPPTEWVVSWRRFPSSSSRARRAAWSRGHGMSAAAPGGSFAGSNGFSRVSGDGLAYAMPGGGLRLHRSSRRNSKRVTSFASDSAEFIHSTLDEHGKHRGCGFGLGMYQYCGKELRVEKVVTRFFDEEQWRLLQTRNMVLLEGVHCDGSNSPDTRGCDRMCFYFWRTEWLEKAAVTPGVSGAGSGSEAGVTP